MKKNKVVLWSLVDALGTLAYITVVVIFMNNSGHLLPGMGEFLAGMTMLTLFVLSASITASLVLGRPILTYIEGAKKEGVTMFLYTLGWMLLFLVLFLGIIFISRI